MQTETLDRLYLEWSQFTKARTERELHLEKLIREIAETMSWEQQACRAEIALAFVENRAVAEWVLQTSDVNPSDI